VRNDWICIYRTGLTTEVKTHALEFSLKTEKGEKEPTLFVQLPNSSDFGFSFLWNLFFVEWSTEGKQNGSLTFYFCYIFFLFFASFLSL